MCYIFDNYQFRDLFNFHLRISYISFGKNIGDSCLCSLAGIRSLGVHLYGIGPAVLFVRHLVEAKRL